MKFVIVLLAFLGVTLTGCAYPMFGTDGECAGHGGGLGCGTYPKALAPLNGVNRTTVFDVKAHSVEDIRFHGDRDKKY
jgi:hypothetical protein